MLLRMVLTDPFQRFKGECCMRSLPVYYIFTRPIYTNSYNSSPSCLIFFNRKRYTFLPFIFSLCL